MSAAPDLCLHQFAFSHYNEKVRWALDWKGLARAERSHLPGFHERPIRRLSGGPTSTPLLEVDGRSVQGSATILERLEELRPTPALFPATPGPRRRVEDWVDWLDDEVGPAVRLALFHELLGDPRFAGAMFTTGQPGWKAGPYRWLFPRLVPMLRERMGIHEASAKEARATITAALDRVAESTRATGYLVGDGFTAADLTAAALLFPLVFPAQLSFALPPAAPPAFEAWCAVWRDHEGLRWVEGIWERHRVREPSRSAS